MAYAPQGLIETPAAALGPTVHDSITIAGRTFLVARPDGVDPLVDHPQLGGSSASDVYQPYWATVWPAARLLAEAILQESWPRDGRAFEMGCGLGLAGLAALAAGLHVTFSDVDAAALNYVAQSARLNGLDNYQLLHMDWHTPTPGLTFPVLLASDLFFASAQVEPIAGLIAQMLEKGGRCLLTDRDRVERSLLESAFAGHRLRFTVTPGVVAAEGGPLPVSLYRIEHATAG